MIQQQPNGSLIMKCLIDYVVVCVVEGGMVLLTAEMQMLTCRWSAVSLRSPVACGSALPSCPGAMVRPLTLIHISQIADRWWLWLNTMLVLWRLRRGSRVLRPARARCRRTSRYHHTLHYLSDFSRVVLTLTQCFNCSFFEKFTWRKRGRSRRIH